MSEASIYVPVLCGSIRRGRNTPRLARLVQAALMREGAETALLDLAELAIPLLEERLRNLEEPPPGLVRLGAELRRCAALAIATPEYNKGYPAALKNALDALADELRGKPVAIAAHSTGAFGGQVVVQMLRPVLFNLGAVPIAAAITVPHVERALAPDGSALEEVFEERARRFARELCSFARALAPLRQAAV